MSKIRRSLMMLIDQKDKDYLCMIANSASTVGLSRKSSYQSLEYSFNKNTWTTMTTSTSLSLSTGDKLYLRGILTNNNSDSNYTNFSITGNVSLGGNTSSLWNYMESNPDTRPYCGYRLFYGCSGLKDASNLFLGYADTVMSTRCYRQTFKSSGITTGPVMPALHMAANCYHDIFVEAPITTVPELPATELAPHCYESMFNGCSGITVVPKLPVTALAEYCYSNMFANCRYLTTVTELPAQTLVNSCYRNMFINCSRLNYIKCLATENINSTNCYNWVKSVASTGTFVKDSSATWPRNSYGIPSNWSVQNNQ